MTSTGFNRNATDAYSWFEIDICTPPVEEEIEERNTDHIFTDHNPPFSTKKDDTKTTSGEPPLTENSSTMPEIRRPSLVTERPPVRMARPSTPQKKNQQTNVHPVHEPPRWDEVLSSLLRDKTIPSEIEALLAMALRHEQVSPRTGLPFFVTNLGTNTTTPLDPAWFTILYERMDTDTQKILISFLSKHASTAISKAPDKSQQGFLFFFDWLLFIISCLLTPLFLFLRKWNESRHLQQSWEYTDIEEQY